MTENDIVRKLLTERFLPDCLIDDIRQAILDAWNGNKLAARYAACVLFERLPSCAAERDAERERSERDAERSAEYHAHRSLWG